MMRRGRQTEKGIQKISSGVCVRLTFGFDLRFRIKVLKNQHFVLALFAHIVELLVGIPHQIQCRPTVLPSHMIRLHQVARVHSLSVAHGQRPVFHRLNQRSPDTTERKKKNQLLGGKTCNEFSEPRQWFAHLMIRTRP